MNQEQTVYSGMSGNEMYCISLLGLKSGNLIVGNSVFSLGMLGGLMSGIKTTVGGEITQVTDMISEGRRLSLERFESEMGKYGTAGASGVTSELIFHSGNVEFLSVGSVVESETNQISNPFSSASDGQELFCQWDAGYSPISFVFGNVAYSIGIGKGLMGTFRELAKGEVKQYSDIFNQTRSIALQRIEAEARAKGANAVVGIKTTILPIREINGVKEMIMIGSASYNAQISDMATSVGGVITSDLTAEETWNMTKLGYAPIKLILGTSVYSLGFIGGIKASFKNLKKGEISDLTQLIYGAREQSLKRVQEQAEEVGADKVLGIKTYIYDIGNGLIEFLAIGTAVKKQPQIKTYNEQLPPQAIIRDKDTFFDGGDFSVLESISEARSGLSGNAS